MAESKAKIEFQLKRKIFDLVGDEGVCTFCKIIPRGPIYQSKEEGTIVCSTCKDSKKGKFQQNDMTKLMEKLLSTLPRSCKFKKNGCKRTMNIQSIEYHEEDCECRDILCPYSWCKETYLFKDFLDHMKTEHNIDLSRPSSKHIMLNGHYGLVQKLSPIFLSSETNARMFDPIYCFQQVLWLNIRLTTWR